MICWTLLNRACEHPGAWACWSEAAVFWCAAQTRIRCGGLWWPHRPSAIPTPFLSCWWAWLSPRSSSDFFGSRVKRMCFIIIILLYYCYLMMVFGLLQVLSPIEVGLLNLTKKVEGAHSRRIPLFRAMARTETELKVMWLCNLPIHWCRLYKIWYEWYDTIYIYILWHIHNSYIHDIWYLLFLYVSTMLLLMARMSRNSSSPAHAMNVIMI